MTVVPPVTANLHILCEILCYPLHGFDIRKIDFPKVIMTSKVFL